MAITIRQAICLLDSMKVNGSRQEDKIKWLSKLDGMIKKKIIDTHEGGQEIVFTPYDENTPLDTPLLVSEPYEDLYRYWLEAQIDYTNGEIGRYNNSIAMFNTEYAAFESFYNRSHLPLGHKRFLF